MKEPASPDSFSAPESESDFDEFAAWVDREIAAGRNPIPAEREPSAQGISISLGDASDIDPELLAALCGPDGLGGQSAGRQFGQDAAADALRPGPVLAALTEQAVEGLGRLSDDQLIGVLRASKRMQNREAWKQALVTAEFARRREAELAADKARGRPVHCRAGEFPGEELAAELLVTGCEAAEMIETAQDLTSRLPATLTGMAAGLIDARRAEVISYYTRSLTAQDAAMADEVLAAAAPEKRVEQLANKAAALEMKLAPEAVRARKERTKQTSQRVEVRREISGNASLHGREMDTADAIAAKAYIDAIAVRLRDAGIPGTLGALRLRVLTELTQGHDPLSLIAPAPTGVAETQRTETQHSPVRSADRAPAPALINLLVPLGTYLGWSTAPGQAGGWGLLDADETRDVTRAAARHPRSRWCVTIIGPDGTAIAHACARGQHPWISELPEASGSSPPRQQAAQLAAIFHRLNVTFQPIADGACDHASAEDRYVPSRRLRHLIRARTTTCTAPGCAGQAVYCDLDHTVAYPAGPSCQCNLAPKCRRHHKCKQAPGWRLEQPEPGVMRWTLPSGRTHISTPTVYDV
jgi:hypothetical protein